MNAKKAYFLMHRKFKSNPDVGTIAQAMGVGTSYFIKKYKAEIGETPRETLNRLRLWWAEVRVTETDMQIQEIAQELHTDTSWFCVIFREEYGMSPRAYRKKYRKNS